MKIVHIISSLGNGGAERTLEKLLEANSNNSSFEQVVICFTNQGYYGEHLKSLGIKCYTLDMKKNLSAIVKFYGLYRIIVNENPRVVQTWMYHSDFFGGLIAKLAGVKSIFWNIRSSSLKIGAASLKTIAVRKLCAWFSFIPTKIVCCSKFSINLHRKLGYRNNFVYVPNGYDFSMLTPIADSSFRNKACIAESDFVFGTIGRFHTQKDYENMINAMGIMKSNGHNFVLVMVGKGLDDSNAELKALIAKNKLTNNVRLMGQISVVVQCYNAFDVFVLSSSSEGFPNVVAEAMSCGIPCVSTDVGDAAEIIGDTGIVVPKENPHLLAKAIMQIITYDQNDLVRTGQRARERVVANYDITKMVNTYNQLYTSEDY